MTFKFKFKFKVADVIFCDQRISLSSIFHFLKSLDFTIYNQIFKLFFVGLFTMAISEAKNC
jgi:hypothetical protein